MAVTTVLSEAETTANTARHKDRDVFSGFSWSAAFAGAIVAAAVILVLLTLESGFGIALISSGSSATAAFFSAAAICFLIAQVLGFAAGGLMTGRLVNPAAAAKEDGFRFAAHGVVMWGLTVLLLAFGWLTTGNATATSAGLSGILGRPPSTMTSTSAAYWTDMLFRPGPSPSQSALDWAQYAQADTGYATDAAPKPPPANPPAANAIITPPPSLSGPALPSEADEQGTTAHSPSQSSITIGPESLPATSPEPPKHLPPKDTLIPPAPAGFAPPASLSADKAEVARIVETDMMDGGVLNAYDSERIATLVVQDTGIDRPSAQRRVDNAQGRIHASQMRAMKSASTIAHHAEIWIALSWIIGAFVAAAAALSARRGSDPVFAPLPRREPG